jgi:Uma2 family endonuclease
MPSVRFPAAAGGPVIVLAAGLPDSAGISIGFDSPTTGTYNLTIARNNAPQTSTARGVRHLSASPPITAEEFAQLRAGDDFDLQRAELVRGQVEVLEAPDLLHGAVVLNLTKGLAEYLQKAPDESGYACFEIGLIVARGPDTVRRPPVSFFVGGERFAELDRSVTQTRPALIVEIGSTNDRRKAMRDRVQSYLDWGVRTVWVVDTLEKGVHCIRQGQPPRLFAGGQSIPGTPVFADLKISVKSLFEMPE